MRIVSNFIHGKITNHEQKKYKSILNPATGVQIAKVVLSGSEDFNSLIESSKKGFEKWSRFTPLKRSRIISSYKELIIKNIEILAKIVAEEHGKTIEDAKGSITRGLEVVEFACGAPHLLKGEFSASVGDNIDSWSLRQPLGICAGITPFNFPAMVPMWMYPISIACGNSFILKPSEKNPSCAIKLAELFTEAGLPEGVFNVVNGDKEIVDMLLESEEVKSVSFVGSTPVAKYIYEKSAKFGKKVQALGGAKNHLLVMPDANLKQATNGIIGAAFGSAGERCMAVSVAVAVGDIADKLVENLVEEAKKIRVEPYTSEKSDMGPLITKDHLSNVKNHIESGITEGAKIVLDGRNISLQGYEDGNFIGPTIFDEVKREMTIYQNEIFGPVLSVVRVKSYDEALELINLNKYANGSSIYTNSGDHARHFTNNIQIGMVGINVPIPVPMAFHSFGGWKNSAFGGHGMHGTEGIHFYTKLKTVTSRWYQEENIKSEFKMPTN
jgi:malonate-semialdehyde dehydrogenase (acetylating) / methylmalonate-semialdehyde dehydrogenase